MDWGRGFKIDKHINHKMRGHGREYMVKIWVLEDNTKKHISRLMVMNLRLTQYTSFMDSIVMEICV